MVIAAFCAGSGAVFARRLDFATRAKMAAALERAIDAQRHAPEGDAGARMSREARERAIAKRVKRSLERSAVLGSFFRRPVREEEIQHEIERMARTSRDPGLLRKMFAALGNDPYLIAEVIGRPAVARREFANLYSRCRRIHGKTRERAEALRKRLAAGEAVPGAKRAVYARREGPGDGGVVSERRLPAEEFERMRGELVGAGRRGVIEETDRSYVIRRLVADEGDRLAVESLVVMKEKPEEWLARQPLPADWLEPEADARLFRPVRVTGYGEPSDFFNTAPEPTVSAKFSGVWTGKEMLLFAGGPDTTLSGRYDPATDTWARMEPLPLWGSVIHYGVWTGSRFVVWVGGGNGGRYDPTTDTWAPMSTVGEPYAREGASVVWTGKEMIVWGGYYSSQYHNDGARYDPVADTWTPVSTVGAPSARAYHTAVWTGTEMIVWGGTDVGGGTNTGGRYDPATDTWKPTSTGNGVAEARATHTAVWTGSEMIVWGGGNTVLLNSGGRYDPATDTWKSMATAGAPSARAGHTAVWTGSEMIVWGGGNTGVVGDGGRYDPATDIWKPTSMGANVPSPRSQHVAVWTGSEMVVWGGANGTSADIVGGRYDPVTDTWEPTSAGAYLPEGREASTAVWTGAEMIVWGGTRDLVNGLETGGRYLAATDMWEPTPIGPQGDFAHTAVWTGKEMIVYGGTVVLPPFYGAYDPGTDSWRPVPHESFGARGRHTAVWTGKEMIVFGGAGEFEKRAGRYDPVTDTWVESSPALTALFDHTAVWTGQEMIVWGGNDYFGWWNFGSRYDPVTDTWKPTSMGANVPSPRNNQTAVWTGSEMIIWGGGFHRNDGGRYDPVTDTWKPTSVGANVPSGRYYQKGVWTGTEMIVWGGLDTLLKDQDSGGRYDPATDTWKPTAKGHGLPSPRSKHLSVFTGREMIVWAGQSTRYLRGGGRYDPATDTWETGWPGYPPLGADILAAKAPGDGRPVYAAAMRGYRLDGQVTPALIDAFPAYAGHGVTAAAGDVEPGGTEEVLAGPGPGAGFPPEVRGFAPDGSALPGLDFLAYGTGGFGSNVGSGRIDAQAEILAGPGPSRVFGPHVRAFRYASGAVAPLAKVSFYAYGTLRYGVKTTAGELDGDGFDEIVTAAGPGAVFGPHVRGFDYDGVKVQGMGGVSFFAYGTLRYGVEAGAGDIEGDGFDEIATGPGPAPAFPSQLRGFDYDGASVRSIPGINRIVFGGSQYGLNPALGDLDSDGLDELAIGAGPDPSVGSLMKGFDGAPLVEIPALSMDVYGLSYGLRVAVGGLGW